MIYHKTTCGCTIKREDMKHTGPSTPYPLLCPHHGGSTEQRFIYCEKCGDKRILKGQSNCNSFLCVPCQQKRNIKTMRAHNRRISKQGRKESIKNVSSTIRAKFDKDKDLERRANCKHAMTVCFKKYEQYNNMPCNVCKRFEQQVFEIDCVTSRAFNERSIHNQR